LDEHGEFDIYEDCEELFEDEAIDVHDPTSFGPESEYVSPAWKNVIVQSSVLMASDMSASAVRVAGLRSVYVGYMQSLLDSCTQCPSCNATMSSTSVEVTVCGVDWPYSLRVPIGHCSVCKVRISFRLVLSLVHLRCSP
jgi:hypothetical protein